MFEVRLLHSNPSRNVRRIEAVPVNPCGHSSSQAVAYCEFDSVEYALLSFGQEFTALGKTGARAIEVAILATMSQRLANW